MIKKQTGFTLLELLEVMDIIGLLASYVGLGYFQKVGESEIKTDKAQMNALEQALDTYRLDVSRYPSTAKGLDALYNQPSNAPKWKDPYLKKSLPPERWGNPYVSALYPSEHADFDLLSYVNDGRQDGQDEAANINNWQ
jgi:general secretion pathway protein G